jgi:hypothetical protein
LAFNTNGSGGGRCKWRSRCCYGPTAWRHSLKTASRINQTVWLIWIHQTMKGGIPRHTAMQYPLRIRLGVSNKGRKGLGHERLIRWWWCVAIIFRLREYQISTSTSIRVSKRKF